MDKLSARPSTVPQYKIWHILALCGLLVVCMFLPFFSCFEEKNNESILFYGYELFYNPLLLPVFQGAGAIAFLSIILSRIRSRPLVVSTLVLGILIALAGLGASYINLFNGLYTGLKKVDILGPLPVDPIISVQGGPHWYGPIHTKIGQQIAQFLWWAILIRQAWQLIKVTNGTLLIQRIFLCGVMISNFFPFYLRSKSSSWMGGSRTPSYIVNGFETYLTLPLFWIAGGMFIFLLFQKKWKKKIGNKFYILGTVISLLSCGLMLLEYNILKVTLWLELQLGWAVSLIFWVFVLLWFIWHIINIRMENLS